MNGHGSILVLDPRSGRKRVIDSNGGEEPAGLPMAVALLGAGQSETLSDHIHRRTLAR